MTNRDQVSTSLSGCLLRIIWMVLGNIGLLVCAYLIANRAGGFFAFSARDIVYGTIIVGLIVSRYIDVRHVGGATVFGTPASMATFRRYLVILFVVALCLWVAAHGVAALRA